MRVNPNQASSPLAESGRIGNQNGTAPAAHSSGTSAVGEDQTQLSGAHAQVQALAAQAAQLPDVRQEKVHALRQAIGSGSYQPPAAELAGALFSYMLVVPGR